MLAIGVDSRITQGSTDFQNIASGKSGGNLLITLFNLGAEVFAPPDPDLFDLDSLKKKALGNC